VFCRGDAQQLPVQDESVDVAINVESSHSYPLFPAFVGEVYRVLAAGGAFCLCDLRRVAPGESSAAALRAQFERAGFIVDHHEDITRNAARSLDQIKQAAGGRLWAEFESIRDSFDQGRFEYHHFVLRKPTHAHSALKVG